MDKLKEFWIWWKNRYEKNKAKNLAMDKARQANGLLEAGTHLVGAVIIQVILVFLMVFLWYLVSENPRNARTILGFGGFFVFFFSAGILGNFYSAGKALIREGNKRETIEE